MFGPPSAVVWNLRFIVANILLRPGDFVIDSFKNGEKIFMKVSGS